MWALLAGLALAGTDLDLHGGGSFVLRHDRLLSPLPGTGAAPSVGLGFTGRSERAVHRAELAVTRGSVRSGPSWDFTLDGEPRTAAPSPLTLVDLRYAFGRTLPSAGPVTFTVGGTSANRVEAVDQVYAFTGTFSYLGVFSVGPWAELHVDAGRRSRWTVEGWVPLLAWVSRSPYALNDDPYIWDNRDHDPLMSFVRLVGDGRPAGPWDAASVNLRASWSYALSDAVHALVSARADLWHVPDPLPVTEAQLGLDVGLRGSFR